MKYLKYSINYNDSINRWWLTDIVRTPYNSDFKTFDADINLGEGYVQIVYPVRDKFLSARLIDSAKKFEGQYKHLYFPYESNRVDFSTFIFTPHHLSCYGTTNIYSDINCNAEFELYTCGGVKLWLNNEMVECFAPYTRNIKSKKAIELPLSKGLNKLDIYFDELAERDVFYYFELRYKGEIPLSCQLEISGDSEQINKLESLLTSCYITRDIFHTNELILGYDSSIIEDNVEVRLSKNGLDSVAAELNNRKDKIIIKDFFKVIGSYRISIEAECQGIKIARELLAAYYSNELLEVISSMYINERKRDALSYIAQFGNRNINKTIAIIEQEGVMNDEARECYNLSLDYIREKRDCADFHLPVMLKMLTHYSEYLTANELDDLKDAITKFRYWIDEPGNDVMWYFSENHAFLFHISQYLTGYMYPNEVFSASGRQGIEQYAIGKERLIKWFEVFFMHGYAEWNSITYIPIDLIGLFSLYDLAPDISIKEMARKALNYTFKILSYNNYNGIISASYGRVYEDCLKFRQLTETSFIEWITSGKGYINQKNYATALYSLSDYCPPNYYNDVKFYDDEGIVIKLRQGVNNINTYNYITKDYCISSVVNYRPFMLGHQQHLMNVSLGTNAVQFFINHPGEQAYSGHNRPSYWAGNGIMPLIHQDRDLQMIEFAIADYQLIDYVHAYATLYDYDEYITEPKWFFGRVDNAYIAIYFSNDYCITTYGANTGKELISRGLNHKIIVRCTSCDLYKDFNDFVKQISDSYIDVNGFKYIDHKYGSYSIENNDFIHNNLKVDYDMDNSYKLTRIKRI